MKQTLKDRIEELERQVRELQARPMVGYPPPVFVPYVPLIYPPVQPMPWWQQPVVTYGDSVTASGVGHGFGHQQ